MNFLIKSFFSSILQIILMNRSTKKIKKLKRPSQINVTQRIEKEDAPLDQIAKLFENESMLEYVTSSLANMHSEIEESQFFTSINGELLLKLLSSLSHQNPQIIINSLCSLQNLIRIASNFSDPHKLEKMLLALGFIQKLDQLQLLICNQMTLYSALLPSLLTLNTEFFETCSSQVLKEFEQSPYLISTLNLIVSVLNKLVSEDAMLALFNFLQVISESLPKMNQLFLHSNESFLNMFKSIFRGQIDNPIWDSISQNGKLKIRSLMIIILFNIIEAANQDVSDFVLLFNQSVGQLITSSLTVGIFKEISNFDIEEQKEQQETNDIEEEKEVKQLPQVTTEKENKIKSTLKIWLNTADSILEQLKFLARLYEVEFDEGEIEFQKDTQKLFPDFFTQNFAIQIIKLIQINFLGLQELTNQEKQLQKIEGYTFASMISETSTFIIRSAVGAVQNMVYFFCSKNQIFFNLGELAEFAFLQINEILKRYNQSLIFTNTECCDDLICQYIKLALVTFNGDKQLVKMIDPQIVMNLLQQINAGDEELILTGIELAKLKFNSTIVNSLEIINQVTDFLIKLMNGDNILVSAQALDCFFDVYTEEDYNAILVMREILQLLKKGLAFWSQAIGNQKKSLKKEDFEFVKMALGNLESFIKYKEDILKIKH